MKIFTAKDIKLMGEPDSKFGQTYWGDVEEQAQPVRFNLPDRVDIMPGRKLVAQEYGPAKSGKPYTQLKKVSLSDGHEPATAEMPLEEDLPLSKQPNWQEEEQDTPPASAPADVSMPPKPEYEDATNARWALKLANDTYKQVMGVPDLDDGVSTKIIEDYAIWLIGAFGRLKNPGYIAAKITATALPRTEVDDGGD